jgi:hypothetical protein
MKGLKCKWLSPVPKLFGFRIVQAFDQGLNACILVSGYTAPLGLTAFINRELPPTVNALGVADGWLPFKSYNVTQELDAPIGAL